MAAFTLPLAGIVLSVLLSGSLQAAGTAPAVDDCGYPVVEVPAGCSSTSCHLSPSATKDLQEHVSLPITATLTALLQSSGVDIRAILCGHVHGYAATELESVPVIISGGASAPLHDNDAVDFISRNNFVLVNVRGGTFSNTVHFVD